MGTQLQAQLWEGTQGSDQKCIRYTQSMNCNGKLKFTWRTRGGIVCVQIEHDYIFIKHVKATDSHNNGVC